MKFTLILFLAILPGCTAFQALFTGANETGKNREIQEKRFLIELAEFSLKYPEAMPALLGKMGSVKKSKQIDIDNNWLSNPNSYWGAVASFGGLVKPWLGLSGMGGAGGILMTMVIGYFRRKKELRTRDKELEMEKEHKDRMHELEKREIKLQASPLVSVPQGTLRGTHAMRMTLAADKAMTFYEDDTGKTFKFNGTNWVQA